MKNNTLLTLDGLAIILVLMEHAYQPPIPNPGIYGIFIFIFTSGYKLGLNHKEDLLDKSFLKGYAFKRLKRLIKPYVGYTLLVIPIFILLMLFSKNLPFLNTFGQFRTLQSASAQNLIIQFLMGRNPFVTTSWFLYTLAYITLFCFIIIYIFNIKILFLIEPIITFYGFYMLATFIMGIFLVYYLPPIHSTRDNPLAFCGKNAFHIYLLHGPFILPFIYIILKTLPLSDLPRTIILIILTIIFSIAAYNLLKKFGLNKFFE